MRAGGPRRAAERRPGHRSAAGSYDLGVERLRPFLTVRDIPLWLAATGLAMLAVAGIVQSLADPSLVALVLLVVGGTFVAIVAGRFAVRRVAYNRLLRIVVALVALGIVFFLPGAVAFVLLPAALALLAVEMMARPPDRSAAPARATRSVVRLASPSESGPAGGDQETHEPTGFDWPEEPAEPTPPRRRR